MRATYISVQVNQTDVYVKLTHSSNGIDYNHTTVVGLGLTTVFPILPSYNVEIDVGKTNNSTATATIAINYY